MVKWTRCGRESHVLWGLDVKECLMNARGLGLMKGHRHGGGAYVCEGLSAGCSCENTTTSVMLITS